MIHIKSKKINNILYTTLVCAISLLFWNCAEQKKSGAGGSVESKAEGKEIKSKIDLKGKVIGYCSPTLNAPYYQALMQSIKATVEKNGMTFLSAEGQNDIIKQVAATEDLITKGVDALLLNPKDPDALVGVTNMATKKGIPVFIIDSSISPNANYVTTIQSNNHKNGMLAGSWVAEKFGDKKMVIAILSGNPGNPVGRTRKEGLLNGILDYQLRSLGYINLDVRTRAYTDWSYAGGLKAMEDIIVAHPEINVVLTESDVCVLGAIKAIEQAGKTDDILIVAGADGQREAIKYIMDTDFYGCTAMNSPVEIGKTAVEYAIQYMNGKRDFRKTSFTPPLLITKENAKEHYNPKAIF